MQLQYWKRSLLIIEDFTELAEAGTGLYILCLAFNWSEEKLSRIKFQRIFESTVHINVQLCC